VSRGDCMCVRLWHTLTGGLNVRIKRSKVKVHLRTFTQDALHVCCFVVCLRVCCCEGSFFVCFQMDEMNELIMRIQMSHNLFVLPMAYDDLGPLLITVLIGLLDYPLKTTNNRV